MAPRKRELNEEMRAEALAKITKAALEVFAENGYHGTTMKQISTATGLSYGLVYHYFPSKEELFRHLVDVAFDMSISTLNKAFDMPGTAWEKIENLSSVLVKEAFTGESSLYFIVMLQAVTQGKKLPGLIDYIKERSAGHYERFVPLLVQAQRSGEAAQGDPALLTASYFAFVQGLSLLVFQEKEMEGKIKPEMLTNILRHRGAQR